MAKERKKNWQRQETVVRPKFPFQDNVENRGGALEATFVRFLSQDNVQQHLPDTCTIYSGSGYGLELSTSVSGKGAIYFLLPELN